VLLILKKYCWKNKKWGQFSLNIWKLLGISGSDSCFEWQRFLMYEEICNYLVILYKSSIPLNLRTSWALDPQRSPWVSSALSFIWRLQIGTRALHVLNLIWFVWLSRSPIAPSGEDGGNFLVQMIFTCLPSWRGRGGGRGGTLCLDPWTFDTLNFSPHDFLVPDFISPDPWLLSLESWSPDPEQPELLTYLPQTFHLLTMVGNGISFRKNSSE
jgi:hypothetical protein